VAFPQTHRSVVLAVRSGNPKKRARALEAVIAAYWRPVQRHVATRWRESDEDSRDFAQGFFAAVLEKGWLARFEPERGRFRTYLLTCLDGYVAKERRAGRRLKRGGEAAFVPLETTGEDGETRELPIPDGTDLEARVPARVGRSLFALASRSSACAAPRPARQWPSPSSSGTTSRKRTAPTARATPSSPRSTAYPSRK
jgi:hypothetical protein